MKRVLSLLLALVMVVGMLPVSTLAEQTTEGPVIYYETTFEPTMSKGDTFTVTAYLKNNPGLGAATIELDWNQNAVKFNGFNTDTFKNMEFLDSEVITMANGTWNQELGTLGFTGIYVEDNNTKDGYLFIANFEVIAGGSLNIGINDGKNTLIDGKQFELATIAGPGEFTVFTPEFDTSALDGLTASGDRIINMPVGASFTAITTDAGGILDIEEQEDRFMNMYRHYIVTIPEGAKTVYLTDPEQYVDDMYDPENMSVSLGLKAQAYYFTSEGEQGYVPYEFEDVDPSEDKIIPKVTIPLLYATKSMMDNSGEVKEVNFVADENGNVSHYYGAEDTQYACLYVMSFQYPEDAASHTPEHTCSYVEKIADEDHLVSPANCTNPATYEIDCWFDGCDNEGDKPVFTDGELDESNHEYVNKECKWCGEQEPVPTYSVTLGTVSNGTLLVDKTTAAENETVTVTATPAEGYKLVAVLVNGEAIEGTSFTMPAKNVEVTATFLEDAPVTTTGLTAALKDGKVLAVKMLAEEVEAPSMNMVPHYQVTVPAGTEDGTPLVLTYNGSPVESLLSRDNAQLSPMYTNEEYAVFYHYIVTENKCDFALSFAVEAAPCDHTDAQDDGNCETAVVCSCGETVKAAMTHSFTREAVTDAAKKSDATCANAALYYYSCANDGCNVIGEESTFSYGSVVPHNYETEDGTCLWCGQPSPVLGYSITMDADKTGIVGENKVVSLVVDHDSLEYYNSYKLELTYDPSKVTLITATDDDNNIAVSDKEGSVIITRFGDNLSASIDLTFKAVAPGEAEVKLTKAYISDTDAALEGNAPEASIIDGGEIAEVGITTITVTGYDVDLSQDFSSTQQSLAPGEDLRFTTTISPYYNYEIVVQVQNADGSWTTLKDVKIDGSGTSEDPYVIDSEYISGNIFVSAPNKEGKPYNVTKEGKYAEALSPAQGYEFGEGKAQYMMENGYQAVLTPDSKFNYTVEITIGGSTYNCTPVGNVYTIPGDAITGNIVFKVSAEQVVFDPHNVTINGSGKDDVVEDTAADTVQHNGTYTFDLKMTDGWDYTVTATMGGTGIPPVKADNPNEDGSFTYTISGVTGTLVITIEKTNLKVEVNEYLDLDNRSMFLITATKNLAEGQTALAYDGNTMFYSERYKAWAYLVIVGEGETFNADTAKTKISVGSTEFKTIPDTLPNALELDVNMSGVVDINDAQLVYDMYATKKYTDLTQSDIMEKLLRADITQGESAKMLDVLDARAVVAYILK